MDLQVINAAISGLAILGAYLIVKPQKAENAAIHKSIDNNTTALKELTTLINDMRVEQNGQKSDIDNLWHRFADLRNDINDIRNNTPVCRREDGQCSKK